MKTDWIVSLWQQRKCAEDQAVVQLLRSRAKGSLQALEIIRTTARMQRMHRQADEIQAVQAKLFCAIEQLQTTIRASTCSRINLHLRPLRYKCVFGALACSAAVNQASLARL